MRKLASFAVFGLLFSLTAPAGATPPASHQVVTWLASGVSITFDSAASVATVSSITDVWVECGDAQALVTVELSGSGAVNAVLDRQGRSGSIEGTLEFTPVVLVGGCDDYGGPTLTSSLSANFETDKGKAERWREDGDRHILRSASGTVSVLSLVDAEAEIGVHEIISR